MIVCIQCALKALVNDEKPPSFDETMEEHMKRMHPDLEATQRERKELERILAIKIGKEASEKL